MLLSQIREKFFIRFFRFWKVSFFWKIWVPITLELIESHRFDIKNMHFPIKIRFYSKLWRTSGFFIHKILIFKCPFQMASAVISRRNNRNYFIFRTWGIKWANKKLLILQNFKINLLLIKINCSECIWMNIVQNGSMLCEQNNWFSTSIVTALACIYSQLINTHLLKIDLSFQCP